jgi:transketolase
VLVAADAAQTEGAIRAMMAHQGPCYLRLGRDTAEDIYPAMPTVEIGGSDLMETGSDVAIVACGLMVDQALKAAELLKGEGISASVLNLYSIKPIDEATVISLARRTGAIVTVEDHSVLGGLGGAVCEVLARSYPTPVEFVGVHDVFGESGTQEELFEKYGLTPDSIASAARRAIARKNLRS